jgi:hypothetical protein
MRKPLLTAAILAASATVAGAVSETMTFSGTVDSTCLITINSAGIFGTSPDFTVLGTTETNGSAGTATILATGETFQLTATAPAVFTASPTGGDAGVTFASFYTATGATSAANVEGATPSTLAAGTTNLSVDLTATKAGGSFPAGNYAAEVTVTCE